MKPEQLIEHLKQYRAELIAIMKRYVRSTNALRIKSEDDPRYRSIVIEITDLLDDCLGENHYTKMIAQTFNEGISGYISTPSYKSVEDITAVISSAETRIKRNPELLNKPVEQQEPESMTIEPPEKITLKWLWENVPARYFWSSVLMLFVVFSLGIKFGETKLYKSLTVSDTAKTSAEANVAAKNE